MNGSVQSEPFPGYSERRTGEALILISLDSISPYFPLIRVSDVPRDGQFQMIVRDVIIEYRKLDAREQQGLLQFCLSRITAQIGAKDAQELEYWCKNVFVHSAEDYRDFGQWEDVLKAVFKGRLAVEGSLGLPDNVSALATAKAMTELNFDDLHAVQSQVDTIPLSDWDKEMYTRHALYDEMRDPFIPIELTFGQLRVRRFIGWLVNHLSSTELADFQASVQTALERDPSFCVAYGIAKALPGLVSQVFPNA